MGSLERRWHYELGQRDARIAELEAEVERLRKKLEAISSEIDCIDASGWYDGCGCCSYGPLSETDAWKDLVSAAKEER